MTGIKWQSPPPDGRSKGKWDEVAEQLRGNPNAWALIRTDAPSGGTASGIKSGVLAPFRPAGSFESRSVKLPTGLFDIYARFVGEVES